MLPLAERMKQADALLAPYAVPHEGMLGRSVKEPEDETRFPFQRDRDRIIHTQSFRRLKGKTQVFVAGGSDHVRTRLTHTMEVAQISRDIARTLGLNEDLAECIALAHDLGHPPFGHTGEEALNVFMTKHGAHFEHNEQSLRIVTVLEEHSSLFAGLNLNREVLEGLKKHQTPHDAPADVLLPPGTSLEAHVVNLADEIAYTAHDCDDGLGAKLFSFKAIQRIPLAREAAERSKARGTSLRGSLIHLLVTDLYATTENFLASQAIRTVQDVVHTSRPLAHFSAAMEQKLAQLRSFLWDHLYMSSPVQACNEKGRNTVTQLCAAFEKDPPPKVKELRQKTQGTLPEAIKDYVAGMTDAYALRQAQEFHLMTGLGAPPDAPEEP
ncbi:MAG: dNTP triphosphohydrolase [Candidatus Peribacteraceae bacterium]|nr:dNTP triphosphohydrolase [Candidatus Peribacteraceae bacterium]MDD5742543.1 dNTP triphosphohydrolase [Candidatus Peribacteraceae bacterium]